MNKCTICGKDLDEDFSCNFNQGRCPHSAPMLNIQPKDPSKNHFNVSMIKSAVRIFAFLFLMTGSFIIAGALLILAEILGVIEEIV